MYIYRFVSNCMREDCLNLQDYDSFEIRGFETIVSSGVTLLRSRRIYSDPVSIVRSLWSQATHECKVQGSYLVVELRP